MLKRIITKSLLKMEQTFVRVAWFGLSENCRSNSLISATLSFPLTQIAAANYFWFKRLRKNRNRRSSQRRRESLLMKLGKLIQRANSKTNLFSQLIVRRVKEIGLWRLSSDLIITSLKNIENRKEECQLWPRNLSKIVPFSTLELETEMSR